VVLAIDPVQSLVVEMAVPKIELNRPVWTLVYIGEELTLAPQEEALLGLFTGRCDAFEGLGMTFFELGCPLDSNFDHLSKLSKIRWLANRATALAQRAGLAQSSVRTRTAQNLYEGCRECGSKEGKVS
jgi:hypothetical protein